MRRIATICVLVLGFAFVGAKHSHADITTVNGYCFSSEFNTLVSCTGSPTIPLAATPTKLLTVSGPTPGPDNVTAYSVGITTQLSCFSLPEPTLVYALGSPGAAAFTELFPHAGAPGGNSISVTVDQHVGVAGSGTARLSLEVNNPAVGPEGLNVKAVWPFEQVEQVVSVVPSATPTATSTPDPNATATPTATSTPTETSTPTGTPTATPTATAPPVFSVRVCVQPPVMNGKSLGGESALIHGLTSPGAACTNAVLYLDGTVPPTANTIPQIADTAGMVEFPLTENTAAGGGVTQIKCQLNGQTETGCTGFLVLQSGDLGLDEAGRQSLLGQIQNIVNDPAQCNAVFGT